MASGCLRKQVFLSAPVGRSKGLTFSPDFLLLNVQSLNIKKINHIEIDYLLSSKVKFVCLTETWAKCDTIKHLNFENFYLGSYYCRKNTKGGGVAIWVTQEIDASVLDVSRFCVERCIEICAIRVNLGKVPVIIINCYRSPSGDINVFLSKIDSLLNYLYKPSIRFVLCGDVNMDGYKTDNAASNDFINLCNIISNFNLSPMVKWPTRVTDATATAIDHVFTNIDGADNCVVLDNTISDHRTILFQSNLYSDRKVQSSFFYERRIFSETSINDFCVDLCSQDWGALYALGDIDDAFNLFFEFLF